MKMEQAEGSEKIVLSTVLGGFFGIAVGSIESVWSIPKLGASLPRFSSQIKHVGGRMIVFAAVGGILTSGELAAERIRQKNDAWNAAFGGALVGVVPAIINRNMRTASAASLISAIVMGTGTHMNNSEMSPWDKYEQAMKADRH